VLWTILPIAALLTLTPGAGTAMVVRSAMRGGWRAGVLTIAANSVGVIVWALLSVLGISALVAASEAAFLTLKLVGAALLVWLGVQSLVRARRGFEDVPPKVEAPGVHWRAFRDGSSPRSPTRSSPCSSWRSSRSSWTIARPCCRPPC